QLVRRMAELAAALDQAEKAPPEQRVRLNGTGAPGAQTFGAVAEAVASGARVPATEETALRGLFSAPADLAAFDSVMARRLEAAGGDQKTLEKNLGAIPKGKVEGLIRREVANEAARSAAQAVRTRQIQTLTDPLNPQVSENLPPDPAGPNTD